METKFCHSCGTEISESSLFCSNCGEKKLLISLDQYKEKQLGSNLIQSELYGQTTDSIINSFSKEGATKPSIESVPKPQKKVLFPFIFIGIFFLFGIFTFLNKTKNVDNLSVNKENSSQCTGPGNASCINNVRKRFTDVGQTIIGEVHIGNGEFEITFMDRNKPGAYISNISTSCDCVITNVSVSTIR